jgi:secondary thiamine-phosphate synthase enzyme
MTDWHQTTITLPRFARGFHLITDKVVAEIPALSEFVVGFLQIFLQHTSASLTLNENADFDVRQDLETAANKLCPHDFEFRHTCEGPDDMPAHVKCSIFGAHLLIPIRNGKLALGVWQGIYLCEHRDRATPRNLVLTIMGQRF